jgi:hypothetical protein
LMSGRSLTNDSGGTTKLFVDSVQC